MSIFVFELGGTWQNIKKEKMAAAYFPCRTSLFVVCTPVYELAPGWLAEHRNAEAGDERGDCDNS